MTPALINTAEDNRREFDTVDAAKEAMDDLIDLGVSADNLKLEGNADTDTSPQDAQERAEDVSEDQEDLEATTPEVVDAADAAEELPTRDLDTDPIEWLAEAGGDLTTVVKGTTVITKKGFRVLQHRYDISTTSEVVVGPEDTDHTYCRVKATAEMPDGRYAEAHAGAHTDRGDDNFLLVSLADTRAKSRALSDITGVGAVALEEMQGVDTDD